MEMRFTFNFSHYIDGDINCELKFAPSQNVSGSEEALSDCKSFLQLQQNLFLKIWKILKEVKVLIQKFTSETHCNWLTYTIAALKLKPEGFRKVII